MHCLTLYDNWSNLQGNDPSAPASFYLRLVESLPDAPDESKMGRLKSWLNEKIADDDSILRDPPKFISIFNKRAETIGLTTGGHKFLL